MNVSVPPPLHSAKRRLPLWVKLLCGFAVFLLALFITCVVAFYVYASGVRSELAEMEATVREAGYPVDMEELAAFYPEIPEAENGAAVYEKAYDALAAAPGSREEREVLWDEVGALQPVEGIPPGLLENMRNQVAGASETLELLQEAASYPKVQFSVHLEVLYDMEWSHLDNLREFGELLSMASLLAAHDGDWNRYGALHGVRSHIIEALEHEPILHAKYLRSALLRTSMTELGLVFGQWQPPAEVLSVLADCYAVSEGREAAADAFAVERCATVNLIGSAMRGEIEGDGGPLSSISHPPQNSLGVSLVDQRTRLNVYRYSNPLVALGEKDWPAWIPETNALEAELEAATYSAPLAKMIIPSMSWATTTFVRTAATVRMIQASIAVEQFRGATGSLPETLAELVPEYLAEVPADPFDGASLRYRRDETGYTIYSVYEDLVDDGGAPMENRGLGEPSAGDWIYAVAR